MVAALGDAGLEVWWDGLVAGGEAFARTIEQRLDSVDAVLVAWSATSIASDWVRDEAAHGRDRRRLVAVAIDGSLPPIGFRQYHAIDLSGWNGKAATPIFEAILRGIEQVAAGGVALPNPIAPPAHSGGVSRRWLIGAAAATVATGAGLAMWRPWAAAKTANSIAVLPFGNLSQDASQTWFSDGLAQEIRSQLASNAHLAVAAPTSSNRFRDPAADARKVASDLGVAWLLEGTVSRAGEVVRMTVTLIDGAGGLSNWSQTFDRPLGDVFAVEREVASAVAVAVAGQAGAKVTARTDQVGGTTNVTAYDLYLQANALFDLDKDGPTYRQAAALVERAIALDPTYARAYVLQSRILMLIRNGYTTSISEMATLYDRSLQAVRKALALAPQLPSVHVVLGYTLLADSLDFRTALPEYRRARALGPGDAEIALSYANMIFRAGHDAEAVAAITFAGQLDPLNPFVFRIHGLIDLCARRLDKAQEQFAHALSLNPNLALAHSFLGDAHLAAGRVAAARAEYMREPDLQMRLPGLAIAAHRQGDEAASRAAMEEMVRKFGDVVMYQQAQVLAQRGEISAAMDALVRAYELKDSGLLLILGDFKLDPLRNRPEFAQMLARMGLKRI